MARSYLQTHRRALPDPAGFSAEAAGAVHWVVFGRFAPPEPAPRLNDARPKVVLSASCGIGPGRIVPYKPLLDQAIALADAKPDVCLVLQRPEHRASLVAGRDHDWQE